ncbi:MAG: PHP domain-containing protein, partial [Chitinivibrionales bacterium]|nr:PHP domain-containing protein [Chitinivibrionales bacterium]
MLRELIAPKKYVDLHIHTKCSDGTKTVGEVIAEAEEKKLRAIAITDHDCIDGVIAGSDAARQAGIEMIPGLELSSEIEGSDIHILGYFIDIQNRRLIEKLNEMKKARFVRAQKIVENLNKMGIDLRFETVLNIAGQASIGRPHIAVAMLKEELVYSFKEAFDKYIGYGSTAYVEKMNLRPGEVFALIRQAGGVPVLAHPGVTRVDERIPEFIRDGLLGIEVYHSEQDTVLSKHYLQYCKKHDLAFTGG